MPATHSCHSHNDAPARLEACEVIVHSVFWVSKPGTEIGGRPVGAGRSLKLRGALGGAHRTWPLWPGAVRHVQSESLKAHRAVFRSVFDPPVSGLPPDRLSKAASKDETMNIITTIPPGQRSSIEMQIQMHLDRASLLIERLDSLDALTDDLEEDEPDEEYDCREQEHVIADRWSLRNHSAEVRG
jgi:hypothetical protein